MYMERIKKFYKALRGYTEMSNHSESWYKYIRICIREIRASLDGLEKEIDIEEESRGIKNNWNVSIEQASDNLNRLSDEMERVAREQYW